MCPTTTGGRLPEHPAKWFFFYFKENLMAYYTYTNDDGKYIECPSYIEITDPHTKLDKRLVCVRCKNWRECENCFKIRYEDYLHPLSSLMEEGARLFAMICDYDDERKWASKLDTNLYMRFPSDDLVFIFAEGAVERDYLEENGIRFFEISKEEQLEKLLKDWVDTRPRKRISGKLVEFEEEEKEYDKAIPVVGFNFDDLDPRQQLEVDIEVHAKTANWQPRTVDELERALFELAEITEKALVRRSLPVEKQIIYKGVRADKINWPDLTTELTSTTSNYIGIIVGVKDALEKGVYQIQPFYRSDLEFVQSLWDDPVPI